ncbi:hypothetical protein KVR01_013201 [Diaporthe batatas]|uniref:uncharacterized protein n=1 Tax=Diaporthe batatas TaxID=748121 RepID=UPI001D052E98|nr:uncharacterized protein KVR01_013201 [Diaporthe batatas]KAG8156979.1 hypothetical protein KVR01_013201 [Diaporthe batatas]
MANKKYTRLLLKWVRNAYKKQDPNPRESSNTKEKHQVADSSPDKQPDDISRTPDTSMGITIDPSRLIRGIKTPFDDGTQDPSDQTIVSCSFDTPDTTPLLIPNPLDSPPVSMGLSHRGEHPPQKDPNQALLLRSQLAPFRVIIVGGGPTGLIMAHALHEAGMDYTLLEQAAHIGAPDTTADPTQPDHNNGTSFHLLWPDSARILDQLGLLRQVQQISCPVRTRNTGSASTPGEDSDDVFARSEPDHGRPCMLVDRMALLRVLLASLPPAERAARVRMGKQVVSVETDDAGVRVACEDGSVYRGSVVVGCDGVHSVVRRRVCELRAEGKREAARRRSFGLLGGGGHEADSAMEARYYGLVGTGPLLDGLEAGVCYETRCDAIGATVQVLTSEDTMHFVVYVPLHRPVTRQTHYPPENANHLASVVANHPITERIRFSDLWQSRNHGKMLDFHEGIADKWYHGRIVLAGSAAHSTTPVLGLGANAGIQGVVQLANGLRRFLPPHHHHHQRHSHHGLPAGPDTARIKRVFRAYQAAREDHARTAALISAYYARAIAQQGTLSIFCNWAAPGAAVDVRMLDGQVAWAVRQGITLEYLEEEHFREGRLRWVNPCRWPDAPTRERAGASASVWLYPSIPMRVSTG